MLIRCVNEFSDFDGSEIMIKKSKIWGKSIKKGHIKAKNNKILCKNTTEFLRTFI